MSRPRKYPWPEIAETGESVTVRCATPRDVDRVRTSAANYARRRQRPLRARTRVIEVMDGDVVDHRNVSVQFVDPEAAELELKPLPGEARGQELILTCLGCGTEGVIAAHCPNPECEFHRAPSCASCGTPLDVG